MTQTLQRHALQNDTARSGESREKESLTAEDGGSDVAHQLNVVGDARFEGDQVPCLDLQHFAGAEREIDVVSARVHKYGARAREFFQDKTLAAEEASAETPDHGDIESDGALSKKESIALDHDCLPRGELKDLDLARIDSRKAYFALRAAGVEICEEERFAHELALDRSEDFIAERLSAHARGPIDAGGFVDHFAGLGVDLLPGLQVHASDLKVVAFDVIAERLDRRRGRVIASAGSRSGGGLPAVQAEFRVLGELGAAIRTECHVRLSMLTGSGEKFSIDETFL